MDHAMPQPQPAQTAPGAPAAFVAGPFTLVRPAVQAAPVVVASPHSGRAYPAEFVRAARLDATALRRSEDSFVEELFGDAPAAGAPLLAATFPRAYCDANREMWELDPAMFADDLPPWVNTTSARVGAGLGTLARVVSSGEAIYREKLTFAEAEARIEACWKPYHEMLATLLAETRQGFGVCLLLDCHSMPAHAGRGPAPDIVLGDAHGTACTPRITRAVEQALAGMGYVVRRNDPYAGGYVTRHYGRPREGVHALQIEVARSLYMDEARITRTAGFDRLRRDFATLATMLAETAADLMRH